MPHVLRSLVLVFLLFQAIQAAIRQRKTNVNMQANRNRSCESGVPLDYLRSLHGYYQTFIKTISTSIPVIRVDYSVYSDPKDLAAAIVKKWKGMTHIHGVEVDREEAR